MEKEVEMSKDIESRISEEAAASEENPDAPVTSGAKVDRPNRARSSVYSIRLNPDEVAAVQSLADDAGIPPSTLVRSWIVERVRVEQGEVGSAEAELRAAQRHLAHLQRHLSSPVRPGRGSPGAPRQPAKI
jgi:hypothetical protein